MTILVRRHLVLNEHTAYLDHIIELSSRCHCRVPPATIHKLISQSAFRNSISLAAGDYPQAALSTVPPHTSDEYYMVQVKIAILAPSASPLMQTRYAM